MHATTRKPEARLTRLAGMPSCASYVTERGQGWPFIPANLFGGNVTASLQKRLSAGGRGPSI